MTWWHGIPAKIQRPPVVNDRSVLCDWQDRIDIQSALQTIVYQQDMFCAQKTKLSTLSLYQKVYTFNIHTTKTMKSCIMETETYTPDDIEHDTSQKHVVKCIPGS